MPKVILHYFNVKGFGEPLRLLLTYFDIEFEDHRVSQEEWPALKPTMPFGTMPVLEIDGKKHAQSEATARYLARKYGLAGKTLEEDYEIDQMLGFMTDIFIKAAGVYGESDEEKKKEKHDALAKDYYPKSLEKLNLTILENNGHLALGRLTWGDFVLAGLIDTFKFLLHMPDIEDKYPGIRKVVQTVTNSSPKVKAFIERST